MRSQSKLIAAALFGAASGAGIIAIIGGWTIYPHARAGAAYAQSAQISPAHAVPRGTAGGIVVELCDGVTHTEVTGLKPGQPMTHAQALAVTSKLMAQWQRKHPNEKWMMAQASEASTPGAAQPAAAASTGQSQNMGGPNSATGAARLTSQQGDTYASFHQRDYKIWKAETDAFVEQGNQVFHSASLLGGTIGVSCDMCHPNAANTHPETYPKYQEQLQKVALLRDMINWCIENPVKGKTLDPNDPKMRALEAYILAQRKGTPLDYGKH
ncbi:MAG: cytochrome C [Candidatus Binataceae bacterium]